MKNILVSFLSALTIIFSISCQNTGALYGGRLLENDIDIAKTHKALEDTEFNNRIISRLDYIRKQIVEGQIEEAEKELIFLDSLSGYDYQLNVLHEMIKVAKSNKLEQAQRDLSERTLLKETKDRLILPDSYEKTVVIDASLPELELPKGAMEELVNRKISITLDGAEIKEIVQLLNYEGLNVVADEALQSDKRLTINVQDVPLKELFAYISRNMGIAFHLGENLIWITEGEAGGGAQLESRIIRLRQGFLPKVPAGEAAPGSELGALTTPTDEEDNDLEEALNTFFADSPEGSAFRIFRNRNILMVKNTRENIRKIEKLVEEFDKPPYQVLIEARFITISQDDLRDLGIEMKRILGGKDGAQQRVPGRDALQVSNFLTEMAASEAASEIGAGAITLSGVIADRSFDILLSAIEKQSSAMTLSSPRVTVMNNRTARIRKGDRFYYFEEYEVVTMDRGDAGTDYVLAPSGTATELPVGITFDVKVNIGNDGNTVLLGVMPSIVEFKGWENYMVSDGGKEGDDKDKDKKESDSTLTPVKLPRIHEQNVATTVGVNSGETVIMGGLITNTSAESVKKVPFLGDIPWLGIFFRRTEKISIPTNLLIFVTATVVNSSGEYVDTRIIPDSGIISE